VDLPCRNVEVERMALAVAQQVDFRGKTSAGAT
jgi:hypothetical protein